MNWDLKKIWWSTLGIKIILGGLLPLTLDESYYWVWGHHLQLSYFDHPPMVAWLFKLGQVLSGDIAQFSRWPGIVLGHLTLLVWLFILKPYFNETQLRWWFALALFSPLLGIGSLILTPDLPLMFFWSVSTLYLLKTKDDPSVKNFILLGALLGLGFCSKYHIALYLPFALIWLISTKTLSFNKLPKIGVGFLFFLLFSSPVLVWNYNHEFISFKFQLNHGLAGGQWEPKWTIMYLIGQILIIFPTLFYLSIKKIRVFLKKSPFTKLIFVFSWLPFLFFLYSSFKSRVEPNWPMIAFPFFMAAAIYDEKKWKWAQFTLGFWAVLSIGAIAESSFVFYSNQSSPLKVAEPIKFNGLINYLRKHETKAPLFARTFQMSSYLNFSLRKPIYKLRGFNRFDFYDMIPESKPSGDIFYLVLKKQEPFPPAAVALGYTEHARESVDSFYDLVESHKL